MSFSWPDRHSVIQSVHNRPALDPRRRCLSHHQSYRYSLDVYIILAPIPTPVAFLKMCYPPNAENRSHHHPYCYRARSRYRCPHRLVY